MYKKEKALPYWMQPLLEKVGFKCLETEEEYCARFETGFHTGQNDEPQTG